MLYVDSDNAMGSWRGDIDDGFALAYLLRRQAKIAGIGSIFGNTSELRSRRNIRRLIQLTETSVSIYNGAAHPGKTDSEASSFLVNHPEPLRVLALGPLTNLVRVVRERPTQITEIIIVGSRLSSIGKWPPYLPHEFNLTKDIQATLTVLESGIPITLLPLDVARRLRIRRRWLKSLSGNLAQYLQSHSHRWIIRNLLLKARADFPAWDLGAAVYAEKPSLFSTTMRSARVHPNGWVDWRSGPRKFNVITGFSEPDLLNEAETALSSS